MANIPSASKQVKPQVPPTAKENGSSTFGTAFFRSLGKLAGPMPKHFKAKYSTKNCLWPKLTVAQCCVAAAGTHLQ
jgi:hypothetical protein